jgi:hypothetical protein
MCVSLAAFALALGGAAIVAPLPGAAVALPPIAPVSISPARGPVGSTAVVSFPAKQACNVRANSVTVQLGDASTTVRAAAGSATITIPDLKPGTHPVRLTNSCKHSGLTRFTVTPKPRPTPTRTPPPTPTPPATRPPTSSPRPTPTRSPGEPTPTPSVTPSAAPTPTPSATPSTLSNNPGGGGISLDRDNIRPGDPLTATGTGCDPGAPVTLVSDTEQVGTTVADRTGSFVASVRFATLQPGRRTITATCGPVLTTHVDLIVSSSTSGQAGTVVVLIFFILVGIALLRWQYNSGRR